jgi:hypothetical protein
MFKRKKHLRRILNNPNDGDDEKSWDCASAKAHFSGNGLGDYLTNMAGNILTPLVVTGKYYETSTF